MTSTQPIRALLVGSNHHYLTINNKRRLKWYHELLAELFPNKEEPKYEFQTMNPVCTVTENNTKFMCPHFFLKFGEPEAEDWLQKHLEYYDLVVFEGTPHGMNRTPQALDWVSKLLRDNGFFLFTCSQKRNTGNLVIGKLHKTLAEIKQIYALDCSKEHENIWQKIPNLMRHLEEIEPGPSIGPSFDEAEEMSEDELLRLHKLFYDDPIYGYYHRIYSFRFMLRKYKKARAKYYKKMEEKVRKEIETKDKVSDGNQNKEDQS